MSSSTAWPRSPGRGARPWSFSRRCSRRTTRGSRARFPAASSSRCPASSPTGATTASSATGSRGARPPGSKRDRAAAPRPELTSSARARAGLRAKLDPETLTRNVATTVSFMPMVLGLDVAGGIERALADDEITALTLRATEEGRSLGRSLGKAEAPGLHHPFLRATVPPQGRRGHRSAPALPRRSPTSTATSGTSSIPRPERRDGPRHRRAREVMRGAPGATRSSAWSRGSRANPDLGLREARSRVRVLASRLRRLMPRPGLRPMRALPVLESRRAELETCVFCPKLCRSACPVSNAEPRETITPWGKMSLSWMAAQGDVPADLSHGSPAWACTGCFACRESCDHRNPVTETLHDTRSALVDHGVAPPAALGTLRRFDRHLDRTRDAARRLARRPGVDPSSRDSILVGCAYLRSGGPEAADAVDATATLVGRGVAVVDGCCGRPLRRAGGGDAFLRHARGVRPLDRRPGPRRRRGRGLRARPPPHLPGGRRRRGSGHRPPRRARRALRLLAGDARAPGRAGPLARPLSARARPRPLRRPPRRPRAGPRGGARRVRRGARRGGVLRRRRPPPRDDAGHRRRHRALPRRRPPRGRRRPHRHRVRVEPPRAPSGRAGSGRRRRPVDVDHARACRPPTASPR